MTKKYDLYAPASGKVVDITQVNDQVFASKTVGDGIAIKPNANVIYAPCDGQIQKIFNTNHALTIKNKKLGILLHLGIDTVELKGKGFKRLIEDNAETIRKGDPLIEMDLDYIQSEGKETDIIMLIPNPATNIKIKKYLDKDVTKSDRVLKVKAK